MTEHPRVCGENHDGGEGFDAGGGTSPRMRGKQMMWCHLAIQLRNIPAYAGKTVPPASEWSRNNGTSPRMRGKHVVRVNIPAHLRNIPAYAGKTVKYPTPACPQTEHPRVCGENCVSHCFALLVGGTSPRMRGKPRDMLLDEIYRRNIPAYAGKTRPMGSSWMRRKEHPRVCGEN